MRLDHLLSKENRTKPRVWFYTLGFLNLRVHTSVGFCSILKVLDELSKWGSEGESPQPLIWGCSSAGRAPALHAGGQEFDPPHLHQERVWNGDWLSETRANSSAG